MTEPTAPEPKPSIYTRLDGQPLPPTAAPLPGIPGAGPAFGQPQPAQVQPQTGRQQFVLATWGSRLGAFLIDGLILNILAWAAMLPIGVALGLTVSEAAAYFAQVGPLPESIVEPVPFYVLIGVQSVLPGIALAWFLLRMDGQTPGKRLLGIRVVREDGLPLDLRTAFRREVLTKAILLPLLAIVTLFLGWLLNYLWPLWDREHRAGHDMIAKTRVVQAPKD